MPEIPGAAPSRAPAPALPRRTAPREPSVAGVARRAVSARRASASTPVGRARSAAPALGGASCCSPRSSRRSPSPSILLTAAAARSAKKANGTTHGPTARHRTTGPTIDDSIAADTRPTRDQESSAPHDVLSEGAKRAFFIDAEHLPLATGFFYAIWLYNSPTSCVPLSKSPAGRLQHIAWKAARLLPANAGEYQRSPADARDQPPARPTRGRSSCSGPFSLSG